MESTDKPAPPQEVPAPEKVAPPSEAPALEAVRAEPPPPEAKGAGPAPPPDDFAVVDVLLRLLLFAAAVVAVVVMVTSKQTKELPMQLPRPPFLGTVRTTAKFNHSPAFIYFVAALSVAGLYAFITTVVSFLALLKPGFSTKLLPHFVIFDVLILGIVAAATGAAAGVAYIGLKGNSHVRWNKVCDVYDKFCQNIAASISVSLFASVVLVFLVILSVYSLSKKIPK
ncbi:hypothetical protein NMG60_11025157 [Bertholletia excelsa]